MFIDKRIEELSNELTVLMKKQEEYEQAINEITIRIHQIAGSISELDTMRKFFEEKGHEAGADSESGVQGSTKEADIPGATS